MKMTKIVAILFAAAVLFAACGKKTEEQPLNAVKIQLSDQSVSVDGVEIGGNIQNAVYVANDIVYYESGKDFTYGEGTQADAHSPTDAASHTVVHITKPGTYSLSGKLSKGQIAVDLGENAKTDPNAVVTLILNGVDITCEVAPAVIFYSVYECGNTDTASASKDVDTSAAGANVILADGSENVIRGSYVARIYKPESVKLNESGTEVASAKKLHKYDGAFYSKMSMNISGQKKNSGVLNIYAENEGLDSELHLTVNGGIINIWSGNDGINTNEDGVSVTTVNGGCLSITVTGETGEGDGIDSNGWLVINGGTVVAAACSNSADAGIDSDMGIHINGGAVIATGSMLDHIADGSQTYAVFSFAKKQSEGKTVCLKNEKGNTILNFEPKNAYSVLIYSSSELKAGNYTLWCDGLQMQGGSGNMGGPGGQPNQQPPEGFTPPDGQQPPEGFTPPDGQQPPNGANGNERPDGNHNDVGQNPGGGFKPNGNGAAAGKTSEIFVIAAGANMFSGVSVFTQTNG